MYLLTYLLKVVGATLSEDFSSFCDEFDSELSHVSCCELRTELRLFLLSLICLQCFDAVRWVAGRAYGP